MGLGPEGAPLFQFFADRYERKSVCITMLLVGKIGGSTRIRTGDKGFLGPAVKFCFLVRLN
jgi:hypothetical protein